MLIRERFVKLKKERECLVCKNNQDIGKQMLCSFYYNSKTKKKTFTYVCLVCMNKLCHNEVNISSVNEAYAESCQ